MSGRDVPQTVADNVFAPRRGSAYWAARIELPKLASDAQQIILRCATAEVVFDEMAAGALPASDWTPVDSSYEDTTLVYDARLKRDGLQIRFSRGSTSDGGEVALVNLDRVLGQTVAQGNRKIAGSLVTVFKVWRVFGVDIGDAVFVGYLKAPKVSGDELRCPVVSDMSRKGAVVGGELLTLRCKNVFKDGVTCTYAGVETFCSHTLDDGVEGCKKYGHEYEFDGVPTSAPIATIVGGGDGDGTGGGTGFGDPDRLFPNPRGRRFDPDFHPMLELL